MGIPSPRDSNYAPSNSFGAARQLVTYLVGLTSCIPRQAQREGSKDTSLTSKAPLKRERHQPCVAWKRFRIYKRSNVLWERTALIRRRSREALTRYTFLDRSIRIQYKLPQTWSLSLQQLVNQQSGWQLRCPAPSLGSIGAMRESNNPRYTGGQLNVVDRGEEVPSRLSIAAGEYAQSRDSYSMRLGLSRGSGTRGQKQSHV